MGSRNLTWLSGFLGKYIYLSPDLYHQLYFYILSKENRDVECKGNVPRLVYQAYSHCTFHDSECEIGQGLPLFGKHLHLPQVNDPVTITSSVLCYPNRLDRDGGWGNRSKGKR